MSEQTTITEATTIEAGMTVYAGPLTIVDGPLTLGGVWVVECDADEPDLCSEPFMVGAGSVKVANNG